MISVSGKKWIEQKVNKNSVEKIKQDYKFNEILSKLIVSRNFDEDEINNINNDLKIILAKDLEYSTGISLYNEDLYFSEINKIWKIENIESWIRNYDVDSNLPKKILVVDNAFPLPT